MYLLQSLKINHKKGSKKSIFWQIGIIGITASRHHIVHNDGEGGLFRGQPPALLGTAL